MEKQQIAYFYDHACEANWQYDYAKDWIRELRRIRRARYEKLSDTEKALFLCRRNMRILRMFGQGIDEAGSETLEEYRTRVGGNQPASFYRESQLQILRGCFIISSEINFMILPYGNIK